MNKKEFSKIVVGLKAAYPRFNMISTDEDALFWYQMLQDMNYSIVKNAVLDYISINTFPPSIANIRGLCTERYGIQIKSYSEAWGTVQKAINTFGWDKPFEAYQTMDDLTVEVVRELGWNNMCQNDNPTATRANFREAYEAKAREKQSQKQLPSFVSQEKELLIGQYVPKPTQIEERKTEAIEEKEVPERNGPPEYLQEKIREVLRR